MSLSKQQAIDIIEREPAGGAQFYSFDTGYFFMVNKRTWYCFDNGGWVKDTGFIHPTKTNLAPMHELLAIAEGEG